jgi:hypothetical protein
VGVEKFCHAPGLDVVNSGLSDKTTILEEENSLLFTSAEIDQAASH